jgi:hypothetical protein
MSGAVWSQMVSHPASIDLRTHRWKLVRLDSTGGVQLPTGAGADVYGVCQNKPNVGEAAGVKTEGETLCVAGGSFNPGDWLTTDASGRCVAATTGNFRIAKARNGSAATGTVVGITLQRAASVA